MGGQWLVGFNSAFDSNEPEKWLVDVRAYETSVEVEMWLLDNCAATYDVLPYKGQVIFEREDDAHMCFLTFR